MRFSQSSRRLCCGALMTHCQRDDADVYLSHFLEPFHQMSVLICNNTVGISGETATFVAAAEWWLGEIWESESVQWGPLGSLLVLFCRDPSASGLLWATEKPPVCSFQCSFRTTSDFPPVLLSVFDIRRCFCICLSPSALARVPLSVCGEGDGCRG